MKWPECTKRLLLKKRKKSNKDRQPTCTPPSSFPCTLELRLLSNDTVGLDDRNMRWELVADGGDVTTLIGLEVDHYDLVGQAEHFRNVSSLGILVDPALEEAGNHHVSRREGCFHSVQVEPGKVLTGVGSQPRRPAVRQEARR